jgi:hypothetical protein
LDVFDDCVILYFIIIIMDMLINCSWMLMDDCVS